MEDGPLLDDFDRSQVKTQEAADSSYACKRRTSTTHDEEANERPQWRSRNANADLPGQEQPSFLYRSATVLEGNERATRAPGYLGLYLKSGKVRQL